MRNCLYNISSIFIQALFLLQPFLCAQDPDTESILQAFRDSYNWTRKVAIHATSVSTFSNAEDKKFHEEYRFYNDDHDQMNMHAAIRGRKNEYATQYIFSPQATSDYFCILDLGEEGGETLGRLRVDEKGAEAGRSFFERHLFFGSHILGASFPFSKASLPELLTADTLSVKEERLEGGLYTLLEGEVPEGRIKIWLSPDKGYTLKKCVLVKEAGKDLDYDGELYSHSNVLHDPPLDVIRVTREIEVLESTSMDDQYLPSRMHYRQMEEYENDEHFEWNTDISLLDIDLNPDFEALNAFEFSPPPGISTTLAKKEGTLFTTFQWEEGKLVPDVDKTLREDSMQETITRLQTEQASNENQAAPAVTLQLGDSAEQETSKQCQSSVFVWIGAVALVLACGAFGSFVFMMKKRRSVTPGGEA